MHENGLNRSSQGLGGPSKALKWSQFSNNPAPRPGHSAAGTFAMEVEKQQHDPQLDMANKEIGRLESENGQLRAQVATLQADKDAVHSALEEVHDRLEDATMELRSTQEELATKCKELVIEEQKVSVGLQQTQIANEDELRRMQRDLRAKDETSVQQELLWAERAKKLSTEFEVQLASQEKEARRAFAELLLQHETAEKEWEVNTRQLKDTFEHKILSVEQDAYQRVDVEFQRRLHEAKVAFETEIRQAIQKSEDDLQAERESSQVLLQGQRSQHELALGQIQALQGQLQSAERETMAARSMSAQTGMLSSTTSIQASHSPPTAQVNSADEVRRMMEALQASHAAELQESRRLTTFFKNNSERISREARELRATNRKLSESQEANVREIEDQLSHIFALEAQMEEYQSHASRSMPSELEEFSTQASISVPGGWGE